jgi:hypothetical protein
MTDGGGNRGRAVPAPARGNVEARMTNGVANGLPRGLQRNSKDSEGEEEEEEDWGGDGFIRVNPVIEFLKI